MVANWKRRGLPRGRALDIEAVTKGYITARDVLQSQQMGW